MILFAAFHNQPQLACIGHDHFVPQLAEHTEIFLLACAPTMLTFFIAGLLFMCASGPSIT